MRRLFSILACSLVLNTTIGAQATWVDRATPPLPTATGRTIADVASWGTAGWAVANDTRASWGAVDRTKAFLLQGVRLGATYGAVFLTKRLVHRTRPCAPECGRDNPSYSFYSAHTAVPVASGSPVLGAITGALRVAAGKHYLTDVLAGFGAGWLAGRIR